MMTPSILFHDTLARDVWNVQIGLATMRRGRSVSDDQELRAIVRALGEQPTDEQLADFLSARWAKRQPLRSVVLQQLEVQWSVVETTYFSRIERELDLAPGFRGISTIDAFLSTRRGCGYDAQHRAFAVSVQLGTFQNIQIVMHEVMHIFFEPRWRAFCLERGVPAVRFWDVKESVTVLLNTWFADELIHLDWGYPEHVDLRRGLMQRQREGLRFEENLAACCADAIAHPEWHVPWA